MAIIVPSKPFTLMNATFTIGDDEFSQIVNQVEFVPSANATPFRGFKNTMTAIEPASWVCNIGFQQDVAPDSLLRFLLDHEGEERDCTFRPRLDGPSMAATLTLSPANVGGSLAGGYATSTVTLGVQGKPEFLDDEPIES